MGGTAIGGRKAAITNKRKHGENFYKDVGSIGGKVKSPKKGFGSNPELASRAGKIGGARSRKPKTGVIPPNTVDTTFNSRFTDVTTTTYPTFMVGPAHKRTIIDKILRRK